MVRNLKSFANLPVNPLTGNSANALQTPFLKKNTRTFLYSEQTHLTTNTAHHPPHHAVSLHTIVMQFDSSLSWYRAQRRGRKGRQHHSRLHRLDVFSTRQSRQHAGRTARHTDGQCVVVQGRGVQRHLPPATRRHFACGTPLCPRPALVPYPHRQPLH